MTYEDCILQEAPAAKTAHAVTLVKAACKGKFPKIFDFDAIAAEAAVLSWREVAHKADFVGLPETEKSEARSQYFKNVITPRVDAAFIEDARTQFDAFSRQAERPVAETSRAASTTAKP